MLLSKLAPRQASLRAFSSVVPKISIGNNVPPARTHPNNSNSRQFQSTLSQSNNNKQHSLKKSVYQDDLNLFKDKINTYVQVNRIRSSNLLFDLNQSMDIYMKLRAANPFMPGDIARLLQSLHTSIRITRKQRNKKKSEHKDISHETAAIKAHILTIASDLEHGVVSCTPWGLIHLFTSFATMEYPEEGIALWRTLSNPETSACAQEVWKPHVVGAVIDLMNASDTPFEEILDIYQQSKATGGESPNLEQAMVGTLIKNNMIDEALRLFTQVLSNYPDEQYSLSRIHDRFVGDCDDVQTALNFFYEGIENKTPYKASTHPSTVVRLMERIWNSELDTRLDDIERVWKTYIANIPRSMGEWMFNTTVHTFLQCFMQTYPTPIPEAVTRLKDIIQFYVKTRVEISPIFLNTVLSSVQPWGDQDIVFTIINAFEIFHLPQDAVSCRIILNSFENIQVSEELILDRWARLKESRPNIDALDLLALLRACFPQSREQLFANVFSEALERGEISDQAILGANKAIAVNDRLNPRQAFWQNLLSQNYIEYDNESLVHKTPFQVPNSIIDDGVH
ncbi:uncharacterized protein SAPINGB_P004574 [Magnusiomyces paraingens]|uniref:Protein RMD9, mitochondrial n=1 Tax=Magnusiomyces paraingens TaxID=2606893 RepID=A0A5E8BVD0_9ASCO|nr:uncharacterized protein SAPINGB_P004574 [Saprochaete ingens]VVT55393.1 unnamed protein product [Saprochaete ingens]